MNNIMGLEEVRALYSVETRTLFDTIDKLSSLGISDVIDPPEIVVVGAKSSGKSSVIQALCHANFPFKDGICTRFTTELALRRGPRRRVRASVRFSNSRKKPVELEANQTEIEQECFDSLIAAAKEEMGVDESNRMSSDDVFRFEIEGPDIYPLTLVEFPGLSPGECQKPSTDTNPGTLNTRLRKDSCVVLAVLPANVPLGNHSILRKIAEQEFDQGRIIGVITKPDLLEPRSLDGQQYIQAVRGRQTTNTPGQNFHVLCNQSTEGMDFPQLDRRDDLEEEFFETEPWSSLPIYRRGISALRKRLNPLIHTHVSEGLSRVLGPIQKKLCELRIELETLGPSRSDSLEMREYLVKLASGFERLVRDGIQGHYNDAFFGGLDGTDRKLRSQLLMSHGVIRYILATKGSLHEILNHGQNRPRLRMSKSWHLFVHIAAYAYDLPFPETLDREDVAAQLEQQAAAGPDAKSLYQESMSLAVQLFRRQSQPWESIARMYLEKVTALTKSFVEHVVEHLSGPVNTSGTTFAILSTYVDPFFEERQQMLEQKLQELLRPYTEGFSMVFNEDFEEDLCRRVSKRKAEVSDDPDSEESVANWIIDTMETFYRTSLRTFTDNLVNLAVESCLVRELPGILTPADVIRMSDARVAELAAETEGTQIIRSQLEADIKLLEDGLKECRRYRPRGIPVQSAAYTQVVSSNDAPESTSCHSSRPSTPTRTSSPASPTTETVSPTTTWPSASSSPAKEGETQSIPIRMAEDISKFESKADSIAFPQSIFSFKAERDSHGLESNAKGTPVRSNILFGGSQIFTQAPTQEVPSTTTDRSPSMCASRVVEPLDEGNHSDKEVFDADGRHLHRMCGKKMKIGDTT